MSKKIMSNEEKVELLAEFCDLRDAGKEEEADEFFKTIPLSRGTIRAFTSVFGDTFLKENGYNLSEAD